MLLVSSVSPESCRMDVTPALSYHIEEAEVGSCPCNRESNINSIHINNVVMNNFDCTYASTDTS